MLQTKVQAEQQQHNVSIITKNITTNTNNVSMHLLSNDKDSVALFANNKNNQAKLRWWSATPEPIQLHGSTMFDANNMSIKPATTATTTMNVSQQQQSPAATAQHKNADDNNSYCTNNTYESAKMTDFKYSYNNANTLHHQQQQQQQYQQQQEQSSNDEQVSQDSDLLLAAGTPWIGTLNANEEDEMTVIGYRKSYWRTFLCWFCILCTAGLLRLVLHWWRHWYLIATHRKCALDVAEKVLVEEDYEGKHKVYYVKSIQNLHANQIGEEPPLNQTDLTDVTSTPKCLEPSHEKLKKFSFSPIDDKTWSTTAKNNFTTDTNLQLPVHFSAAQFKFSTTLRMFTCKQVRYAWDHQTQTFQRLNGLDVNVNSTYFHQQKGLTPMEQRSRRLVFGPNEITVPYKDIKTLLFLEVLNPFYVFQIFSVILWFTYEYYYYAVVILLMSIFGITMSIIQMKKNQDALRATVQNTGHALVVGEGGNVVEIATQQLVPGDIIEIPSDGCIMQCDSVLLSGNCIVDEAMLTGESVPVTKTPLPAKRDVIFDKKEHARHTLFCGTKVIQTRYIGSEKVLAIVINTGNITAKGALVRSILYPPPVDYRFEQDSYKFIECLAVIALIGFTYTLVSKIMRNIDPVKIAVESLDLITIVVPPALPAAMTVGRLYAQKQLERKNIYCISPRSINVAGSIDCCCFDKTGTLTEDGLDMWGVVPKSATNQFQIPIKDIERLPFDNFLFGMVTCHSITILNGKRMGDPLDLKMFESTGWILEDQKDIPDNQKYGLLHPTIVRQPVNKAIDNAEAATITANEPTPTTVVRQSSTDDLLAEVGLLNGEKSNDHGIVREFPFTSSLQRMSVITRRLCEQHFNVYCKGSPEMLQQLCLPSSLPSNYSQQLEVFAKQGYRIIALAYKELSRKINYTKVQRLTRECVESDLEFLGFVVLENRLKPDTAEVINSLTAAKIRTVMITGDNILTALSVARDCGIVTPTQAVVTVNVREVDGAVGGNDDASVKENYELYYTLELGADANAEGGQKNKNGSIASAATVAAGAYNFKNDKHQPYACLSNTSSLTALPNSSSLSSVKTCETWTHNDIELAFDHANSLEKVHNNLAAGEALGWRKNYRFAMVGKTWEVVRDHFPTELHYFITRGAIFARMSPEQKQHLIMELQSIDYCVAMCGDGANDCGALKAAHTGISLSETESSIASPFTSRNPTIASVPNVIKEGRAALVTSFGIFKYMAAYSMVQFVSVMILYSIDSNLTDKQYLYVDLGLISVFAFFFGKTEAFAGPLVSQVPLSSLISLTPLMSIVLHLLVVVLFQVAGWFHVHSQSWFVPFVLQNEEHLGCLENYTMFAISCFQYIILAFVFSKGAPYRKAIWTNKPLCFALIIDTLIVLYLILYPTEWIANFFQLVLPPQDFRYIMLVYGVLNFVAHVLVESFLVEYLIFKKFQVRREKDPRTSKRKYMQVEYELRSYHSWPQISEVYTPHAHTAHDAHTPKDAIFHQPTYVELGAEQHFENAAPPNNALSSFFEVDTPHTPNSASASASS